MKKLISLIASAVLVLTVMSGCAGENNSSSQSGSSEAASSEAPVSSAVPQTVTTKNIIYKSVGHEQLMLDVYQPADSGSATPAVIYFHGGGWASGSRDEISSFPIVISTLLAQGIAVVTVDYQLADGSVFYDSIIADCCDSLRFITKNAETYNIDPSKLGVAGVSAGGYLALMSAFAKNTFPGDEALSGTDYSVNFILDISGPADFSAVTEGELSEDAVALALNFFGESGSLSTITADAGVFKYISEASELPALYIIHGRADSLVPYSQSAALEAAYVAKGGTVSLLGIDGADHSYDAASGYTETSMSVTDIFAYALRCIAEGAVK